jgi:Spy/CpxP family protein refolding chaperone
MKLTWHPIAPAFLLGLALGAAAGSWGQRVSFRHLAQNDADRHRMMIEKLSRELSLDEKQKAAMTRVMDLRKSDVDTLKAETFARLETIRAGADAELVKMLTPAQAAKLAEMHRGRRMKISWEAPEPAR